MTANELRTLFSKSFGFTNWPSTYEVDAETYGHVCKALIDKWLEIDFPPDRAEIKLGPNGGIYFKGVELILK